ncbi:MAG: hypothetical protein ABI867_25260 [Kofleriaceae bacterium]
MPRYAYCPDPGGAMRIRPSMMFFAVVLFAVACGGGGRSGDDDDDDVDAAVDGSGGGTLTGLGQKCVVAMQGADCPANAPGCLSGPGAANGICTNVCVNSASFMTNAQAQIGTITPDPAASNGTCTGIFTGTVGTAACTTLVNIAPADNPLVANKAYTALVVCDIICGAGGTCDTGLTCDTASMRCKP